MRALVFIGAFIYAVQANPKGTCEKKNGTSSGNCSATEPYCPLGYRCLDGLCCRVNVIKKAKPNSTCEKINGTFSGNCSATEPHCPPGYRCLDGVCCRVNVIKKPVPEKPFSPPKNPAVPYRKQVRSGSKENGKYGLGKRGIRGRRIYRGRARGRYRFGKYSAARGRGRQKGRGHRIYYGQGKGRGRGKD